MPVTRHPLRRSGREALPHPAPTSGVTASCLGPPRVARWLAVQASTPGTRAPGSASGACGVAPYSPWAPSFPPLAPPPRRGPCSQGSSVRCWCLTSPDHTSQASVPTFPVRTLWTRRSVRRSPSSCARSVRACQGSQTAQSQTVARGSAPVYIAFHSPTGVGTLDEPLSRRHTPPTRAPTNFSSVSSRRPPHGLGPMWFATPSS